MLTADRSESQLELDWTLDPLEVRVSAVLRRRVGRSAAIRVPDLAEVVYRADYTTDGPSGRKTCERAVQAIVKRLREEHGQPILSTAGKPAGYYMAETPKRSKSACASSGGRRSTP